MSTAVLDSHPQPSPRRISRVASEPLPDQAARGTSLDPPTNHFEPEDPLIAQLGRLASQHHASEYSRLKFGANGSPVAYVPYSVQMPDHYQEMQAHQLRCVEKRAWWPSRRVGLSKSLDLSSGESFTAGASMTEPSGGFTEADLHERLSAAISSPLIDSQGSQPALPPEPQPHWQTSETHPIVISTIIPPELLPILSSHLERSLDDYPTMFKLPRSHLLDRILPRRVEPDTPKPLPIPVPPPIISPSLPSLPSRTTPSQSIARTLKLPTFFWVHPTVRRAFLTNPGLSRSATGKRPRPASFGPASSVSYTALQSGHHQKPLVPLNTSASAIPQLDISIPLISPESLGSATEESHTRRPVTLSITTPSLAIPEVPPVPKITAASLLGNLYMSSCPGKKVRLDGPVRGRSTVCRDLRSDFSRIKNVGVACIVCCLDDDELNSLGVSWTDYVQVAGEMGIDILRIPIPEGLPPNDPATLDSHLSKLIDTYTLRGSAILVHCRGGVGRAGIIACCWMLKLGLCGWLDREDFDAPSEHASSGENPTVVSSRTLRLVERLIGVVRRRRSPKAIETYEQVRFLVDYVEFLREQAEPGPKRTSVDWFADWDVSVE
ncbi:hypothetical protein BD414DRAFT_503071 [Trametes punicea]|nr:hypothetical protein BD414DRAFT_503071 [Trametes punicea]